MRILIITDSLPLPLISGNRIRLYNLVRRISREHKVSLATLVQSPNELKFVPFLDEICEKVVTVIERRQHPLFHLPGLAHYALKGMPMELKFKYSKELVEKIHQLVSQLNFDIIQIEPSHMAMYIDTIPTNLRCKRILTFYDIAFAQFSRIASVERGLVRKTRAFLHGFMMRQWEPIYAEKFDRCITVSEVDKNTLLSANPNLKVEVVPNGVDTKSLTPLLEEEAPPSLIYVGNMNYSPCADAAIYFCREIFPLIRKKIENVELWLVGREPENDVLSLSGNGVHITGRVENVTPYYQRSLISVVPLRSGGGTRLKILEAMAFGRPVVSTSIGCEGLDVVNGENILVADEPRQFAEKVVQLIENKFLREKIKSKARSLVRDQYDWDQITEKLINIYSAITK